jgi:hypothetical protein
MRRCEDRGHRAAFRDPEDGGALALGGVHDREKVVGAFLQRCRTGDGVGQSGPPFVEEHETAEGREALVAARHQRILPYELDVRDEPWCEHHVDGASPDNLIGDADIAGAGVSGSRCCHPAEGSLTTSGRSTGVDGGEVCTD